MTLAIKICGLTTAEAVREVALQHCAYAGFVFYRASPRHLEPPDAARLAAHLTPGVKKVAVTVNADDALLEEIATELKPDYFQLHGAEAPARLLEIRAHFPAIGLIKAIGVRSGDDVAKAGRYEPVADMLMFDAKPPEMPGGRFLPGGNALSFDWTLLAGRQFGRLWFLSGGLSAANVREATALSGAKMVDVSSSVEQSPGVKDPALIAAFCRAARGVA
jgi:phosphoribosylanthranilate isomerase